LPGSHDLLSLCTVTRQFPGFLLDRVTFSLRPGAVMGLLGPNGAGKTTIIKLILNLIRPDAGSIRVFGLDSQSHEIMIKRDIGYVGENALLPPNGTARWLGRFLSICFPSWDDSLYRYYLDRFGVPMNKPARALSKGTRTKLALAAAMGHRPRLLILDEPTSGLDPIVRLEVVGAIREAADEGGRSVLFSTHIVSDLEAVADTVTVINRGRVLVSEEKDVLLSKWRRMSFQPNPSAARDLERLCQAFIQREPVGGMFTGVTNCYSQDLAQRIRNAAVEGTVGESPLSLEEVFVYLVNSGNIGAPREAMGR